VDRRGRRRRGRRARRALSPFRHAGTGGGGDVGHARALGRLRLGARGAYARATLHPATGRDSRRTRTVAGAQLVALLPAATLGPARLLAGAGVDGQWIRASDRIVVAALPGAYRVAAASAFVTVRPTLQLEGGRRTAVALAVAPAVAGLVWRPYGPGSQRPAGALVGPGRLGAVEQVVTVTRALGGRTAVTAAYRASVWRVRGPGAAPGRRALDQRLTAGLVLGTGGRPTRGAGW
jgi:hypothetical protein